MKKFYIGFLLLSLLSACARKPYAEEDPNAATGDNPYAQGNTTYGNGATYGNEYGNGNGSFFSANRGNGTYNDIYGDNPYAGSAQTYGQGNFQANNQASTGDYYNDPSYGTNVTGGPGASAKDRVIYFSYDSSTIDQRAQNIIREHAHYLRSNPQALVILEGHTDERGTRDYNIALGERRAQSVRNQFQALGVNTQQMRVLSYGEERPAVWGSTEADYAKNRRVVIIY